MNVYRLAGMLVVLWLSVVLSVARAAPVDQAYQRARDTFVQTHELAVDPAVVDAPWVAVPFDQVPFTYTFDEMRQRWPQLMRGLRLPFPSPEYLKARYSRFPDLYRDLHYQDHDWQQHSENVLEVWQAFFRGDLRHARDLGNHYGGYARVPAVLAQITYAVYLAPSQTAKQQLLQQVINQIQRQAGKELILPSDKAMLADYCMYRLGFSYAVARLAEDESVPVILTSNYAPMVINAATEMLAVEPDHPLALALSSSLEANVVRRVGKAAGKLTFATDTRDAEQAFGKALKAVDDMAIVRYEYANSLLYTGQPDAAKRAEAQLQKASNEPALYSMEWLDRAYARKRLKEIQSLRASGMSFARFDRKRRKFMARHDANLYAVTGKPFLVD
ncbi:hypothetical protein A11A3_03409 [Alcanivorax hongdengensis A-11-3]|uniref:Uncharacterized protein n=1 Tax=Alcanivorax hongdengensis A-11-3 TaxID=1177179 RepID=L0WGV8_9GAMM|nr:hypothetical protein [Alcanivorax hongdengensis]EKF75372.1 hypothetical protein A11A3_03409 [Alcanivorax hongdengensis A-11-3]